MKWGHQNGFYRNLVTPVGQFYASRRFHEKTFRTERKGNNLKNTMN
jgi:hypothetical protein